jgi:hypothetical protein
MNHVAMMRLPLSLTTAARCEAEEKSPGANKKYRALLAVDGRQLTPEFQFAALKRCVQFSNRLDILLLNPPKPPTLLLGSLLLRLEHSGIDYRMTSGEGDLGAEVLRYLQRFQRIELVIVDSLSALERCLEVQRLAPIRKQHCYISLSGNLEGASV